MLSEISQAEKDNYHMVTLIYGTYKLGRSVGEERDKERGGAWVAQRLNG